MTFRPRTPAWIPLVAVATAAFVGASFAKQKPAKPDAKDSAKPDAKDSAKDSAKPDAAKAPAAGAQTHPPTDAKCVACHTEDGWLPAKFNHERTGFSLRGAHRAALCAACHHGDYAQQTPVRCAGCHRDPHAQEFGLSCQGCHREDTWQTTLTVQAHRRTNFPLSGRHAQLPCEECHGERRGLRFTRQATDCRTCHLRDFVSTRLRSVDHRASNFSQDCRACHSPILFSPASFLEHERCFPIRTGPHRPVGCGDCHVPKRGLVQTGACRTGNTRCTACHTHRCETVDGQHDEVLGYACADQRCVGCHTR